MEPRAGPAATRGSRPCPHAGDTTTETDSRTRTEHEKRYAPGRPKHLKWLFEVNRDWAAGWLLFVFASWLRCVSAAVCRGCRRCGPQALVCRVPEPVCHACLEFGEPVEAF